MSHGIHPEAVDAKVQPEAEDILEFFHHFWVSDVEVGLLLEELVQVVLPSLLVPLPC